ncbi:MAG: hypothetical protein CMK55_02045 [Proteobacteria bacterium]|nr:hypothetical protein [Pseudomonadota bacterium]|tara:strand:- start:7237 stop:7971 length:735 start_codon:yes stop_codon:yes gene_type:complete
MNILGEKIMKKITLFIYTLIGSALINATVFVELGVSDGNTDIDSFSFLNPVGTGFTSNTTSGDFINLANLNDSYEKDGRSVKIGMEVLDNIDVYLVHKTFGDAQATGTATFSGFAFTQELNLDISMIALGVAVNVDLGNNHSISPVLEIGQADIGATGRQISPIPASFNSFPAAENDSTTFGYGIAYAYTFSEDFSLVASYMINDLGNANTGVTGSGIAGMNAGEQLQSEVEITEFSVGLRLSL